MKERRPKEAQAAPRKSFREQLALKVELPDEPFDSFVNRARDLGRAVERERDDPER